MKPGEIKQLAEAIDADRLRAAKRQSPDQKFASALELSDDVLSRIRDGVRILYPEANEEETERIFKERRSPWYMQRLDREGVVATPEDVVVTKLRWARDAERSKDVEDLKGVIGVNHDLLDWDYIHRWADEHGTRELLDEIRANIPDID